MILIKQHIIIPSKKPGTPVIYTNYRIQLNKDFKIYEKTKIAVKYRLLGHDKIKEQEVFLFSAYSDSYNDSFYMQQKENVKDFDFISSDYTITIFVKPGKHVINKDLVIGKGRQLRVSEGTELVLNNNAKIISFSQVYFSGTEEFPIVVTTTDSTGQGIIVSGVRAEFKHVIFQSMKTPSVHTNSHDGVLNAYESKILIDNCIFSLSGKDAFNAARSDVSISNTLFKMTDRNAINLFFSKGNIENVFIDHSKNDGIKMSGSYVRITGLVADNSKGCAISALEYSEAKIFKSKITKSYIGVEARDQSIVEIDNFTLEECETGFKSHQKGEVFGASQITVKNLKEKNNKKLKMVEMGSKITIN